MDEPLGELPYYASSRHQLWQRRNLPEIADPPAAEFLPCLKELPFPVEFDSRLSFPSRYSFVFETDALCVVVDPCKIVALLFVLGVVAVGVDE